MGSLGTISVGTSISMDGINKGVKEVEAKVDGLGKRIIGGVTNAVNSFSKLGLATIGISALVDAFKGLIGKPLELAANAEIATKRFSILMGSGTEAKKFLGELKNFRNTEGSLLDSDELKHAAASLMAIGVNADQVIPTIRNLSNISSGLSVPLDSMISMYEKVRETGTITSRELKSAAKEGIPLSQAFADMFQTTKDNIRDMAQNGQITFEHFEKAINNLNKPNAIFANMNKEMTNTLSGAWTVLQNKIKERSQKFGEAISKNFNLTKMVQLATTAFEKIQDASIYTMEVIAKVGSWISANIISPVADGFNAAADIIEQAIDYLDQKCQQYFPNMGDILVNFGLQAEFTFKNFKAVAGLAVTQAWMGLVLFGNDVADLFTVQIPNVWNWMGKNWNRIWDNCILYVGFKWEQLKNIVAPASDWIAEKLAGTLEMIGLVPEGTQKAVQQMNKLDANRKAPVMPEMAKLDPFNVTLRDMTPYEKELKESIDKQQNIINDGFKKFVDDKKKAALGPTLLDLAMEAITGGAKGGAIPVKLKPKIDLAEMPIQQKKLTDYFAPIALQGSKEARSAELTFRYGISRPDAQKEVAKNTKRSADGIDKMVEKLDKIPVPKIANM